MEETQGIPGLEAGPDRLVGSTIQDRYRVLRKLGQGGMGAVYLAEHLLIKKRVAIKCLHGGLASNQDAVRRFHNEAVAATAIGHPNIVDVTDMGRFDDGSVYMVLEYLQGRDWQADLDRGGAQPVAKVAHIGLQVCDALAAAGRKSIVHRDLKPENIFLIERQGDPNFVKVLDFGISKFKTIDGATQTGALLGTPYYMAPEQMRGEPDIDHLADVYSTGVIFYQALSGELPFDAQTLPELVMRIATEEPLPIERRVPDLPDGMTRLIKRMLAKNPGDRPRDFDEVAFVLRDFDPRGSYRPSGPELWQTQHDGTASEEPSGEGPLTRPKFPTPAGARGLDTAQAGTPVGLVPTVQLSAGAAPRIEEVSAPSFLPKPVGSRLLPWLLGAGALVLAGLAFWRIGGAPASPEPASESAPTADSVRVQISTIPPDAEISLDGRPLTNPFDGQLPTSAERATLRATRPGFKAIDRTLVLTSEQRVFIQLEPLVAAPATAPPPATSAPAPSVQAPAKTTPRVKVAATPQPTAPPAPAAAAPPPAPAPAPAPAPTAKPALKKVF